MRAGIQQQEGDGQRRGRACQEGALLLLWKPESSPPVSASAIGSPTPQGGGGRDLLVSVLCSGRGSKVPHQLAGKDQPRMTTQGLEGQPEETGDVQRIGYLPDTHFLQQPELGGCKESPPPPAPSEARQQSSIPSREAVAPL